MLHVGMGAVTLSLPWLFDRAWPAAYGPRVQHWEMVKSRAWGEYYNVELKG